MQNKNNFRLLLILIFTFFSGLIQAIEFPNPHKIYQNSLELKPESYPDADHILLADIQNIKYLPDGTAENVDDVYVKILSEKGRADNRTLELHFSSHYQIVEINLAELIKTDGRIVGIDIPSNSRTSVSHHQMGSNIYDPSQKVKSLNIPGLELGDIIHYRFTEKTIKARMPNNWADIIPLQSDQPVLDYQVEIIAPEKLPLANLAVKDEVKGTFEYNSKKIDGGTVHNWHVKKVPQVFPEPDMPPLYTVVQRLIVGTVPRWEDISKWYWNLSLPRLEKTTPAMEEEVKKLCEDKGYDEEKIRAIFDFVSQKVRYMGITTEDEAPGYEPHDVSITFENRYGVCRDKAALLVAMLRLAGFKAYPVMIMAGPKKDPEVPNPYFNHAITCVEKDDGSYILMDSTGETNKELMPSYLCDKSYLVAKPEGDTLRTSPIIPASDNMIKINTICEIRESGSADAETEIKFYGINDSLYRASLVRKNPEQILDFAEDLLRQVHSEASLRSFDISPKKLSDTSSMLSLKLKFYIPEILLQGKNVNVIIPPQFSKVSGVVNFLIEKMGLEKRTFPLCTDIACGVSESLMLKPSLGLGDLSSVTLPPGNKLEDDIIKWETNYSIKNELIVLNSDFRLKSVEYSPEQYLILKKIAGKRDSDMISFPILEKRSGYMSRTAKEPEIEESGIRIISEDIQLELTKPNSWLTSKTVSAELLDFSGKKKMSEIKIEYNEGCAEVKLDYAKVISKDGSIKEISKDEINLMDQESALSAPRYPHGRILVISLPGIDIGSKVEYKISKKSSNTPFFCMMEPLKIPSKIEKKKISIKNPNRVSLKISERINGILTERISDETSFNWEFQDLASLKRENDLPPVWTDDFIAASSGDWKIYQDSLTNSLSTAASGSPSAQEILKQIFGEKTLRETEKITLIRDFVAKNIREAGPSIAELPHGKISDANEIFKSGYANKAERAVAIAALLSQCGISYDFVPCSSIKYLDNYMEIIQNCPQSGLIDNVLLRLTSEESKGTYLNSNDQYAELGIIEDEGVLGLDPKNSSFFKITPPEIFKTGTATSLMIRIDSDGSALMRHKEVFSGMEHATTKKYISELTPENLKRFYQERTADMMSLSTKIEGVPKSDFGRYPGFIEISGRVDDFAKFSDERITFVLPNPPKIFERLQKSRKNPYLLNATGWKTKKYIIAPPEGYEIIEIIPAERYDKTFDIGTSFGMRTFLMENKMETDFFGNTKQLLVIDFYANFAAGIFSGENYRELFNSSSQFNSNRNFTIVLRKRKPYTELRSKR
ncbi:MAG TPA: DUF3857 domain-containing protein [Victivallales bacterium]|nr:DUF3857 domain-containing protein [Victivallales bacterium]